MVRRFSGSQMMPGSVSDSYKGRPDDGPYVPSWCYPNGPRVCLCGYHEGYHNDAGECLHARHFTKCQCKGLSPEEESK